MTRPGRWGGLAGIVAVLGLVAGSLLVQHSPSTDQPTGDITSYFTDNRAAALLTAVSVVVIRSGVLPLWLGWAGLVVAATELVGAASFGQAGMFRPQGDLVAVVQASFGLLLWVLATSVFLLLHPSPATGRKQARVGAEPR